MVRDTTRNRLLVFGGFTGDENSKDLWAVPLGSGTEAWSKLNSWTERRIDHQAFYDPVNDRMIVFGGQAEGSAKDGDGNVVVAEFGSSSAGVWKALTTTADATAGRPDGGRLKDRSCTTRTATAASSSEVATRSTGG
jgi:hypothetical protein